MAPDKTNYAGDARFVIGPALEVALQQAKQRCAMHTQILPECARGRTALGQLLVCR